MNGFIADIVPTFITCVGHLLEYNKHWWFSGRMLACHAGGPGSIFGQCIFGLHFLVSTVSMKNRNTFYYFLII